MEDMEPGFSRFNTAFLASMDVKTAFDVAKPSVVSRTLALTGVHGHVAAALLAEMQDVQGSACISQGGMEAPVLWGRAWPNSWFGKPRKNGRPEDGVSPSVEASRGISPLQDVFEVFWDTVSVAMGKGQPRL